MKGVTSLYIFFFGLCLLIYLGTNTKTEAQQSVERSRTLMKRSFTPERLLREAMHELSPQDRIRIDELNVLVENSSDDSTRLERMKLLAGAWFELDHREISGHYAEQIANLSNTAESWSIAGTTYLQAAERQNDERMQAYCLSLSRSAFSRALMLDPEDNNSYLNQALSYVEYPSEDNPMQGIQMLMSLAESHPDYAPVFRHLGRLGMQTGQYEKAIERLRRATQLEGAVSASSCMLAEAFDAMGLQDSVTHYQHYCQTFINQ